MTYVKKYLQVLELKPSKKKGQNFLIDETVLEKIFQAGEVSLVDKIIEIGPGLGALTKFLYAVNPPIVIELEDKFCQELKLRFPLLNIINADVRTVDFSSYGQNLTIYGNLPYSFSTDIVFHLTKFKKNIRRLIFLLQKEFAERMASSAGGRNYGVLSVNIQIDFEVVLKDVVKGNCFHPPTKVDSRIVVLTPKTDSIVLEEDKDWFKQCVRACFFQRRKKIVNSIIASNLVKDKNNRQIVKTALDNANIDSSCRAETLSIQKLNSFSKELRTILDSHQ